MLQEHPRMIPCNGNQILWRQSEQELKLRYTTLVSDRDDETQPVKRTHMIKVTIENYDWLFGYVQKWMGLICGKRVSMTRRRMWSDYEERSHSKRESWTACKVLWKYYQKNVQDIQAMRNGVWTISYHSISSDEKPQYQHCPIGKDSWCKYNCAAAEGKQEKHTSCQWRHWHLSRLKRVCHCHYHCFKSSLAISPTNTIMHSPVHNKQYTICIHLCTMLNTSNASDVIAGDPQSHVFVFYEAKER